MHEYPDIDPLALFGRQGGRNWTDLLEDLAGTAWESAENPARGALDDWLGQLVNERYPDAVHFDAAIWSVVFGALGFGVRYGFGLARTWPDGIDQLDRWSAAAWTHAEIDTWIAREKQADVHRPGRRPLGDDAA